MVWLAALAIVLVCLLWLLWEAWPFQPRALKRPLPKWFDEAKFGVMIHWIPASVPGFAPLSPVSQELLRQDYHGAFANAPYAEWYKNCLGFSSTPTAEYHREKYGERTYWSFQEEFEKGAVVWDPVAWAKEFKKAGAGYVVLVCKHHDGYCLWPSTTPNPHRQGWHSPRDLVSLLAKHVRAQGMRFGVYYSGGLDWTFDGSPIATIADLLGSVPHGDYCDYAESQVRELIDLVKPDILWNDIGWPTPNTRLFRLFEYYYRKVPEGVVNDRWQNGNALHRPLVFLFRRRWWRKFFDSLVMKKVQSMEEALPPGLQDRLSRPPHFDFVTPEYTKKFDYNVKWECVRGIDRSFGYKHNSPPEHFISKNELIHGFVDIVAGGGNLLLNVGPRGTDAVIPEPQLERLEWMGEFLRHYGDVVRGSTTHTPRACRTECGIPCSLLRKGNTVYAFLKERPAGETVVLPHDAVLPKSVRYLEQIAVEWVGAAPATSLSVFPLQVTSPSTTPECSVICLSISSL